MRAAVAAPPRNVFSLLLRRAGIIMPCIALAGIAGTAFLIREQVRPMSVAEVTDRVATLSNPWIDVVHPFARFDMPSNLFGRTPAYTARRRQNSEGQEDMLTFGRFGTDAPWLRMGIYRAGSEGITPGNLFIDLARHASDAGIAIIKSGQNDLVPTRFGMLEVAGVTLAQGRTELACLGMRLLAYDPDMQITGLACGTEGQPIEPQTIACVLDRLDVIATGDDQALAGFFARSETRRGLACQASASGMYSAASARVYTGTGNIPKKTSQAARQGSNGAPGRHVPPAPAKR
jgi:hypothetical protein